MNVRGSTRVLGIFGDPVAHSLSPLMQNAALRRIGLDAIYVPFRVEPEHLATAVQALRALHIYGVNVTIPHKERILPHLDRLDPVAEMIGAVNTVVNEKGRLVGYNTDAPGLLQALNDDLDFAPDGRRILLLGAGGASRAALVACCRAGASWIGIANRTRARAEALAETFRDVFPGTDFAVLGFEPQTLAGILPEIDLLVNGTALGLKGESFDWLPWESLPAAAAVMDLVYRRDVTPLVRTARNRGHRAADGTGMLVAQGEAAFALWTGRDAPPGVMKAALEAAS
jgi:shikimate dehydrogenase